METKSLSEYTWQELLDYRFKVLQEIENLEAAVSVIKDEIVERLATEGIEGKIVGSQAVSLRTNYTCDKEMARSLGAVKTITQERIDVAMLKQLHLKGIKIEGLQIIKTPIITEVVKKDKDTENS